jgi:hypothetical protein
LYEEHHSIKMLDELRAYEIQIDGHLASVDLLEKRAQEILSLVRFCDDHRLEEVLDLLTDFCSSKFPST